MAGGSCSTLWEWLAEQKTVCSLVLVCPPAKDNAAMLELCVPCCWSALVEQASGHMYKCIVEVWTSRLEIGTVSETFVYVRFPYHLWAKVEELGDKLSQGNLGTHHFTAYLCLDDRKKNVMDGMQGWDLEIQSVGQNIPEWKNEDHVEMQAAAKTSTAEKLDNELQVNQKEKTGITTNLDLHLKYLCDNVKSPMHPTQTWKFYSMLNSWDDCTYMSGMLQLGDIVINAAEQASDPMVSTSVMCCGVKWHVKFPESPLLYDLRIGR